MPTDETYWREIQQAFTLDRTIINLNNGGCCPSPRVVHEALKRYLDLSNQAPVYHMWQILEPNIETVRRRLAAAFGCDTEELAITRNASEALQIAQLGIDLKPGDEVVTTNQDYGRMLDTWDQRARRDGIKLKKISFPVPPTSLDVLAERLLARDHARDEGPALLPHHEPDRPDLPGQADLRRGPAARDPDDRRRRARVRAFPFRLEDLGCDYYGTSLHKWLLAPIGTGFLYVRREHIAALWPLTPANETRKNDIRKFEEIGTHPAANHNAIAEALAFHEGIGSERKAARLRYLRDRWATRLEDAGAHPAAHEPRSGAVLRDRHRADHGCSDARRSSSRLWDRWRIIATPIVHAEYEGIRVTPNVYTTLEEVDTFAAAMEEIVKKGAE